MDTRNKLNLSKLRAILISHRCLFVEWSIGRDRVERSPINITLWLNQTCHEIILVTHTGKALSGEGCDGLFYSSCTTVIYGVLPAKDPAVGQVFDGAEACWRHKRSAIWIKYTHTLLAWSLSMEDSNTHYVQYYLTLISMDHMTCVTNQILSKTFKSVSVIALYSLCREGKLLSPS